MENPLEVEPTTVAARLGQVRARIEAAAARAGRPAGDVLLVAVTKTVPARLIREAVAAGQRCFGENRVQEAREKIPALGPDLSWHMIGHLQRNKARVAAELFDTVESVDSLDLAHALDRHAAELGRRLRVLLQVKEAEEPTKSGIAPEEAPALIERICALAHLELAGLMAIPPPPAMPGESRPHFARLRELRNRWDGRHCPPGTLRHLSMGMSHDFEIAVEEGATMVRVGTAIFGERG